MRARFCQRVSQLLYNSDSELSQETPVAWRGKSALFSVNFNLRTPADESTVE